MSFKHITAATLITAFIIFVYIKTVEAETVVAIHDTTTPEITLSTELLDKEMAVMVLGGIDYYVQECSQLTPYGVDYRNKVIEYHEITETILPINPTYLKGALSVTGYNCQEMYELIVTLDNVNLVEEPILPTKHSDID